MTAPVSTPARSRPSGTWRRALVGIAVGFGILVLVGVLVGALDIMSRSQEYTSNSYAAARLESLEIKNGAGRVELYPLDTPEVEVSTVAVSSLFGDAEVMVREDSGRLLVQGSCTRTWISTCQTRLRIGVPSELAVAVSIDSTAGDVLVEGVGDDVAVRTGAGDIQLSHIASRRVRATTTAGDVNVDLVEVPDDIEVRTTAGDVQLVLPDAAYDLTTNATAGDVTVALRTDPASAHRVVVTTTAGDIDVHQG